MELFNYEDEKNNSQQSDAIAERRVIERKNDRLIE